MFQKLFRKSPVQGGQNAKTVKCQMRRKPGAAHGGIGLVSPIHGFGHMICNRRMKQRALSNRVSLQVNGGLWINPCHRAAVRSVSDSFYCTFDPALCASTLRPRQGRIAHIHRLLPYSDTMQWRWPHGTWSPQPLLLIHWPCCAHGTVQPPYLTRGPRYQNCLESRYVTALESGALLAIWAPQWSSFPDPEPYMSCIWIQHDST